MPTLLALRIEQQPMGLYVPDMAGARSSKRSGAQQPGGTSWDQICAGSKTMLSLGDSLSPESAGLQLALMPRLLRREMA